MSLLKDPDDLQGLKYFNELLEWYEILIYNLYHYVHKEHSRWEGHAIECTNFSYAIGMNIPNNVEFEIDNLSPSTLIHYEITLDHFLIKYSRNYHHAVLNIF